MAGDLEDFLRRAAARRQAQADQPQPTPRPPSQPRPEYSNRRTEHPPRATERPPRALERQEPEVIVAEIMEDSSSISERMQRQEEARQAAREAETIIKNRGRSTRSRATRSRSTRSRSKGRLSSEGTENLRDGLIEALKSPGGIRKAILLREILERPTHRW